jgi:hypothetical protein
MNDQWAVNSERTLQWTNNVSITVDIELSTDNGATWEAIASSYRADSLSYTFAVPSEPADSCLIRIVDSVDAIYADTSDVFTIAGVTLQSHNGGAEPLMPNTLETIRWNAAGINNVRIEYTTNDGMNWEFISSTPALSDSFVWRVPDVQSDSCRIRVTDLDNRFPGDMSDTTFVIGSPTHVEDEYTPTAFTVSNPYPNPFNPSTTIDYALPRDSHVRMTVYNAMGQQVTELVDDRQAAGRYTVQWNAAGMSSGVYFYRIEAGEFRDTGKMLLMK